jgi:hypothetical protein
MKPKKKEKYQDFVKRFMKDKKMIKEYPDIKQRFAVMASYWRSSK